MAIVRQITLGLIGILMVPYVFAQALNLEQGKQLYDKRCAVCHTLQVRPAPAIPILNGQLTPYLTKELLDYKSGNRKNAVMNTLVTGLTPTDLENMIAYIETAPDLPVVPVDPHLYELGEMIYRAGDRKGNIPACAACHAPDGSGNYQASFPRLAGQNALYIEAQLDAFKTAQRRNDPNQMMEQIAAKLSPEQIHAVADYVAAQRYHGIL